VYGAKELHRGRIGRRSGNDDGVFHRALLFEFFHELRNRRALLADTDIDAVQVVLWR
jgi:hypothetical protein